jgi:hypothetical protein
VPVVDRFLVQVVRRNGSGELVADDPIRMSGPDEAISKAEAMQDRASGVIAYSWRGDMRTGELGRLIVLKRAGVLPLSILEQVYSAATPY